jgi:branched-chain amino acid transport system permease protein
MINSFNRSRTLQITAFLLIIASLPYWLIPSQSVLAIAILTILFAAAAAAYNLTAGLGGQVSFGHSIFFGLGAYATALTREEFGWAPWLSALLAISLAVAAALFMALPSVRLDGVYFVLVTFVATLTLEAVAVWATDLTGGAAGVSIPLTETSLYWLSFDDPLGYYYLALSVLAVILIVAAVINRRPLSLFLRAIKDDPQAAAASGVQINRAKVISLIISAALTSLVGVAYIQYTSFIDPASAFGSVVAVSIALPAIFGGLNTFWGPPLGAFILIPVQQSLNPAFSNLPAGVGLLIFGILVMAIQVADPRGAIHLLTSGITLLKRPLRSPPDRRNA